MKRKIAKIAVTFVGILFVAGLYVSWRSQPRVYIGPHAFRAEFAVTDREKQRGLSERDSIANDYAMVFLLQVPGRYGFWMKNMKIPLDMIWVRDKTVVQVMSNVPVPDQNTQATPIYEPEEDVDTVIEVQAGTVERLGIQVGDAVRYEVD